MANTIEIVIRATDRASDVIAKIEGKITGTGKTISGGFDQVGKSLDGLVAKLGGMDAIANKMGNIGQKMTIGVTLPLAAVGVAATKAASDLAETTSKVGVLFGEQAKEIEAWAKTADKALGMSRKTAMDAASTFSMFGKSAGLAGDEVVSFSKQNVQLAADMASFFNTSPEDAIMAIGAAFRGEMEPIRRYNVMLDDASMRQEALRLGIIKSTKEALTPQQKVLAAQALIMKQTSAAQGDFARTADGMANSTRSLNASLQNALATLGEKLLPIATDAVRVAGDLLDAFNGLSPEAQKLVIAFGGIAAAAGPVLTVGSKLIGVVGLLQKGVGALGSAAGPIGLVIAGLIAVVTYLNQVGEAAKKSNDELIKMSSSGDLFQQAAASTEILLHGQDRLKKTLDEVNKELAKSDRSYDDYAASLKATAVAAGYEIDAYGNLIKVTYGLAGRQEELIQSNYLLSESQRDAARTSELYSQSAEYQAFTLDLLANSALGAAEGQSEMARTGAEIIGGLEAQSTAIANAGVATQEALEKQVEAFKKGEEAAGKMREAIGKVIESNSNLAESLAKATGEQLKQALAQSAIEGVKKAYESRTIDAEQYEKAVAAIQLRYGLATPASLAMSKAQSELTDAFLAGKLKLEDYISAADKLPAIAQDGIINAKELASLGLQPLETQFINTKKSVEDFLLALKAIPPVVTTTVVVNTRTPGNIPLPPIRPGNIPEAQRGADFIVPPNPRGGNTDFFPVMFSAGERVIAIPGGGNNRSGEVSIGNVNISIAGTSATPEQIQQAVYDGIAEVFNGARA